MFFMNLRVDYHKFVRIIAFIIIMIVFGIFFYNNIFLKFFYVANEKVEDQITGEYKRRVDSYYINNIEGEKISGISDDNLIMYEADLKRELKSVNAGMDGNPVKVTLGEITGNKDSFSWEIFSGKVSSFTLSRCEIKKEKVELMDGSMQTNLVFYGAVKYRITSGIFSRNYEFNVFFQMN